MKKIISHKNLQRYQQYYRENSRRKQHYLLTFLSQNYITRFNIFYVFRHLACILTGLGFLFMLRFYYDSKNDHNVHLGLADYGSKIETNVQQLSLNVHLYLCEVRCVNFKSSYLMQTYLDSITMMFHLESRTLTWSQVLVKLCWVNCF